MLSYDGDDIGDNNDDIIVIISCVGLSSVPACSHCEFMLNHGLDWDKSVLNELIPLWTLVNVWLSTVAVVVPPSFVWSCLSTPIECITPRYTSWAIKNMALYFCPCLGQLLTDFQNSFTGTVCGQFAIM